LLLADVKEMEEKQEVEEGLGHQRTCSTTHKDMVDFHVNQRPLFQDHVTTTKDGSNLSVRMPANLKAWICLGQDK
jgi:hypothetical protein